MTTGLPTHSLRDLLSEDSRGAALARAAAAAGENERYAAFFHACTWDIAAEIFDRMTAHRDDIATAQDDAEQHGGSRPSSPLHPASRHIDTVSAAAAQALVQALNEELAEATSAVDEATRVRSRIAGHGDQGVPPPPASGLGIHRLSPLEAFGAFHHQLDAARRRVHALRSENIRVLQELVLEEDLRRQAAADRNAITLKDIDLYCKDDFHDVIADLADGTPHPAPSYSGQQLPVTAALPDGRPVVFLTKHLPVYGHGSFTPPPLPALGLPDVLEMADAARHQFPGASMVAVTNGRFSPTAQRYAQSSDVRLLGREGLERWATWSCPLPTVLGSCEAHTATETKS
ncbi:hypothetical protein ACIBUY_04645 [Streptomyces sp. NPDC050085]|uniref:hypothetical protein n=1 Tax=Streptomyces sp. NPDC050085 TaxID=3365600 RepID=UPI0037877396